MKHLNQVGKIDLVEYGVDEIIGDDSGWGDEEKVKIAAIQAVEHIRDGAFQEAVNWFRFGVVITKNKSALTQKKMSKVANIDHRKFILAKSVAEHFNCDEERFIKEFREFQLTTGKNIPTFAAFRNHALNIKYVPRYTESGDSFGTTYDLLKQMRFHMKRERLENPETYRKSMAHLKHLKKSLANILPDEPVVQDTNYLMYSNCCSCDAEAPPEGFKIVEELGVSYPKCNPCIDAGAESDKLLVARLWTNYAKNMESSLEKYVELF